MDRRHAFTLIELLVVISIIALLIAILLPVLGQARRSALDAQCKVGIRSLGQAYHTYLVEHKEKFVAYDKLLPGLWNSPSGGSRRNPVILVEESPLMDYITADRYETFTCPVFREYVEAEVASAIPEIGVSYSYTVNGVIDPAGKQYKPYDKRPLTLGTILDTTGIAMFVEENPWSPSPLGTTSMNDGRYVVDRFPNQDSLATFHSPGSVGYDTANVNGPGGKLNTGLSHVVFLDNHVDAVPSTDSEVVAYGTQFKAFANRPQLWPN